MNVKTLNELSLLDAALSVEYSNYITSAVKSAVTETKLQAILNIYAAYCYLIEQGNYTAFEILNNSNLLNAHFQSLIGFVYDSDDITTNHKYVLCNELKRLFRYIAQDKQLTLDEVQLSNTKITEDASSCLAQFLKLKIDRTKADYLSGWQVVSKEGKSFEVHLDTLYVNFGGAFTNKIHLALKNYAYTALPLFHPRHLQ